MPKGIMTKAKIREHKRVLKKGPPAKRPSEKTFFLGSWKQVNGDLLSFCRNRSRYYRLKPDEFAVSLN